MQIPVGLLSYRELQCPSSGLDLSSYYAKTTFHRINVTSWFINGGRRTVSFYSSKVGASISPFYKRKRSVMVITGITRGTRTEASEKGTECPQR